MTNEKRGAKQFLSKKRILLSTTAALAAIGTTSTYGFGIDSGNPDVQIRWDNQIRYNAGWRMQDPNPHFGRLASHDETESRFKKHDMITNRLNLLSEFDLKYQDTYGFRVSAAAWYENAYSNKSKTNPDLSSALGFLAPISNYGRGAEFSPYAKRYVAGSSGEFLDAFVFGRFNLGSTSLNLKLGRHNVYWGESLYSISDSIAAGQGPVDTIKAATSTGAVEAKELFLPIQQLSAEWTLNNELSLLAQYQFDWKPFRLVPGGAFFAASDGAGNPPCANVTPGGGCMVSLSEITPGRNGGDWGLAMRWSPEFINSTTFGAYYRKYDEKLPWSITQSAVAGSRNPANFGVRLSYARDTELLGLSMTTEVAGVSFGTEFSYRKNTALNSVNGFFVGSQGDKPVGLAYFGSAAASMPLSTTPAYEQAEGARGDTWHLLMNGIWLLPHTAIWDAGTLQGEITYQRLGKITKNGNVFFSEDYACKNGYLPTGLAAGIQNASDGCATKDAWGMNVAFTPEWAQVVPGVNLKMPFALSYGLKGNAPTIGGAVEGAYKWSLGLTALYQNQYEFGLAYTDGHADYKTKTSTGFDGGIAGEQILATKRGGAEANNRAWLSFYFKTTF